MDRAVPGVVAHEPEQVVGRPFVVDVDVRVRLRAPGDGDGDRAVVDQIAHHVGGGVCDPREGVRVGFDSVPNLHV